LVGNLNNQPKFNLKENKTMKMERVAEIIKGWPYDGSISRAEVVKDGSTLVNGDWVVKQSDGTVDKPSGAVTLASGSVGLVVVGNGDSASAANSGKAEVLWSSFIAKISSAGYTAGSYAPGTSFSVNAGKPVLAVLASGTGSTFAPGDAVVGTVLDVVAVSTTETAHITVLVK
jgi:hypothetical protein